MGNQKIETTVISAEHEKNEFLREALISFGKDGAPSEFFEQEVNFAEKEHTIVEVFETASYSYQASVGYDREEPYIDKEIYFEKEPYIDNERYYDTNTKTYKTKTVTKYKDVQRERPVTKYKSVTDWSPWNGKGEHIVYSAADNDPEGYIDSQMFLDAYYSSKESSHTPKNNGKCSQPSEEAVLNACAKNLSQIKAQIISELPGDRSKDLTVNVEESKQSISMFIAPEYTATVSYDGKAYEKKSFPFGDFNISGYSCFEKPNFDLEFSENELRDYKSTRIGEYKREAFINALRGRWKMDALVLGVILLSIIFSCFVHRWFLVLIFFAAAVAGFIFHRNYMNESYDTEQWEVDRAINAEKKEIEDRIKNERENAEKTHESKVLDSLNKKLTSLGLKPADAKELGFKALMD